MNLLLDTQALLWFLNDDPQLASNAKSLIEEPATRKLVSIATQSKSDTQQFPFLRLAEMSTTDHGNC